MTRTPFARLTWSRLKLTITGVDAEGRFLFRIADRNQVRFMTNLIHAGLEKIREENQKAAEVEGGRV